MAREAVREFEDGVILLVSSRLEDGVGGGEYDLGRNRQRQTLFRAKFLDAGVLRGHWGSQGRPLPQTARKTVVLCRRQGEEGEEDRFNCSCTVFTA